MTGVVCSKKTTVGSTHLTQFQLPRIFSNIKTAMAAGKVMEGNASGDWSKSTIDNEAAQLQKSDFLQEFTNKQELKNIKCVP